MVQYHRVASLWEALAMSRGSRRTTAIAALLAALIAPGAGAQDLSAITGPADCAPVEPDSVQISWEAPCDSGDWLFEPGVGCRMWDWHPAPSDGVTWTGQCKASQKVGWGVVQWVEHGQPIVWGASGEHGVVHDHDTALKVVETADVDPADLVVHDAHAADPSHAFDLSRLAENSLARTPIGVFRDVDRPVYDDLMREQLDRAADTQGPSGPDALAGLLAGSDTWTVD